MSYALALGSLNSGSVAKEAGRAVDAVFYKKDYGYGRVIWVVKSAHPMCSTYEANAWESAGTICWAAGEDIYLYYATDRAEALAVAKRLAWSTATVFGVTVRLYASAGADAPPGALLYTVTGAPGQPHLPFSGGPRSFF